MMLKNKNPKSFSFLIIPAILIFCFIYAVTDIENSYSLSDKKQLEDSIRKASAACYAAEGVYRCLYCEAKAEANA